MLNELKLLSETLESAGIQIRSVHNHLVRLAKNEPIFRVSINKNGKVTNVSPVSDEDRKVLYKFSQSSNGGSWPALRIQNKWGVKDAKCFARSQKVATVLADKVGQPPSHLSAFSDLIERTALLSFEDLQSKVQHVVGDKEKFLLVFEIVETQKKHVCHPDCYNWINEQLLEPELTPREGIVGVDAYGVPLVGNEDQPMPVVNLSVLGLTKLRAMNPDCPSFIRYGKSGGETFEVSTTTRQKFKNALEYVAPSNGRNGFGTTWSKIDVGEDTGLFIAYPSHIPKTGLFLGGMLSSFVDAESDFQAISSKVIDSLRQVKQLRTDATINMFALLPNQQLSKRVSMVGQYSVGSLIVAVKNWRDGIDNTPEMRGKKVSVLPFQISKESRKDWKRNLNRKILQASMGLSASECFDLFLGCPQRQQEVAKKGIRLYARRWKNFMLAPVPERKKNGAYHRTPGIFYNKYNRLPATLGIFLHKLGVLKMDYMKSYPFLCGQLVQSYDALHEVYCNVERAGSHPKEYVGSSCVHSICRSDPRKGFERLAERSRLYIKWAKSQRNIDKFLLMKKSNKYLGANPRWYIGIIQHIQEQMRAMGHHAPTKLSDEDQVVFNLGYMCKLGEGDADQPVSKPSE